MKQSVTMKLEKKPKSSGGVKYSGKHEETGEDINIYVPQQMLKASTGGDPFPEEITLTISAS